MALNIWQCQPQTCSEVLKTDFTYKSMLEHMVLFAKHETPENIPDEHRIMLKELNIHHEPEHTENEGIIMLRIGKMPTMFRVYPKSDIVTPGEAPDSAYEALFKLMVCNGFFSTAKSAFEFHQKSITNRQIREN